MQFTTAYRQTTKQRRRCMICRTLIKDGERAFFKGPRGRQGKAVHDSCRSPSGGDWWALDCAFTFVQDRFGGWTGVTDYTLQAAQEQRAKEHMHANTFREYQQELADGLITHAQFATLTARFQKSEHGYILTERRK